MKKIVIPAIALISSMALISGVTAGNANDTNKTVAAIKMKNLKDRKASLERKIAEADKQRNKVIDGVSAEAMEVINDRQDSVCLELRSELVSVELEIKELTPDSMASRVLPHYNALVQSQQK